ncbi:hypothetical protein H4582DRAFT_1513476 [Lactarius indigo]|nr:hypothetical protein H4582DRAFT_1513476 [Lactarius indigo]
MLDLVCATEVRAPRARECRCFPTNASLQELPCLDRRSVKRTRAAGRKRRSLFLLQVDGTGRITRDNNRRFGSPCCPIRGRNSRAPTSVLLLYVTRFSSPAARCPDGRNIRMTANTRTMLRRPLRWHGQCSLDISSCGGYLGSSQVTPNSSVTTPPWDEATEVYVVIALVPTYGYDTYRTTTTLLFSFGSIACILSVLLGNHKVTGLRAKVVKGCLRTNRNLCTEEKNFA